MDAPHTPDAPAEPPGPRGLVAESGRGAGAVFPLRSPVTLVGRAAGCDVRVEAQAVHSLHCLLAPGSDGIALRALHADGVTVNGRPATTALLHDGDRLAVGPCAFRVRWPAAAAPDAALEPLRIQAAAVAAQQAALTEHELRLNDRAAALARQEEQLAGHLEEQRRQLLDLQDQITAARSALRKKRADHAALADRQTRALAEAREAAADLLRENKAERQRLIDLRHRLIQRWRRHWQACRRDVEAREAAVRRERDRLAAERESLTAAAAESHGRIELDDRRLKEAWAQFRAEQQQRTTDDAIRAAQTRDLARRAKAVAAAERRSAAAAAQVDQDLRARRRELEALETRIAHGRKKLLDQQAESLRPEPAAGPPVALPPAEPMPADAAEYVAAFGRRAAAVARVAEELADQRLLLAEQAERLLRTHTEWVAERAAALDELEAAGATLQERERAVRAAEGRVRGESESVARDRLRLEADRARAAADDADRRAEQDRRRADLDARDCRVARLESKCVELYRLWGRRRRQEADRLRAEQEAGRAERAEWAAAAAVWLRAGAKLRDERRAVAAQALALARWRADLAGPAERPAAVKRLERIERQWATFGAAAARELDRLRATAEAEAARLDDRSRRARQEAQQAAAARAALDDRAAEIEREALALEAERARAQEESARGRARWERAERQAAELRDEVERVARLLIDAPPPASQAA